MTLTAYEQCLCMAAHMHVEIPTSGHACQSTVEDKVCQCMCGLTMGPFEPGAKAPNAVKVPFQL